MTIGCIIQARTTSSRLPGKVLLPIDYDSGTTVLDQVIERARASSRIDRIIIATTTNQTDEPIREKADALGCPVFQGSEEDVLSRYYDCAKAYRLDAVVRLTSDCPFIDPMVIDDLIQLFEDGHYDYASNCLERTYPHGIDCEIFTMESLEKAYRLGDSKYYREHVTTYIYSHPDDFRLGSLKLEGEDYSGIRITVDTTEDYALACVLNEKLKRDKRATSFREIVALYKKYPYLEMINAGIIQKKRYDSIQDELQAAIGILRKQELDHAADAVADRLQAMEKR